MSDAPAADAFWSARGTGRPSEGGDTVDERLRAAWAATQDALGDLVGAGSGPTATDFFAFLGERCAAVGPARGDAAEVMAWLERHDAAELGLALACAELEPRAVRRFEGDYFAEIRIGVSRLRCSDDELDEVTQSVRRALFERGDDGRAKLLHRTARGDLRALLRVMALRAGLSARRRRDPTAARDDLLDLAVDGGTRASLALVKREHRQHFREALEAALAELSSKERTVLRLAEVDGVPPRRLATMYRVDRSTITRWLARARADVLAATRRQLRARFGIAHDDFERFVDVIRSDFGVSIHRLLAVGPESAPPRGTATD